MIDKTIVIDFWKPYLYPIEINQYEADGRTLKFQFVSGSVPIDLTAADVVFYAKKSDGNIVFNDCVVTSAATGKATYKITAQTCILDGEMECFILITTATPEVLRSQVFTVTVKASDDVTSAVESTSEFTALEVAIATVTGLDARVTAAEGDIVTLDGRVGTAETDINTAEANIVTLQAEGSGWISAGEAWIYASASTITIAAGGTARYQKGDRLRWKQGGAFKYGVVVAIASTLITILVNTDYTVANAAITDNYVAHGGNPLGYPDWFNIAAPTWNTADIDNGSGGQPTTSKHVVKITGNTLDGYILANGTKVAATWFVRYAINYGVTPLFTYIIGSGNVGWASNDHFGNCTYSGGSIAIMGDSTITIPDNTVLAGVSARFSFQF